MKTYIDEIIERVQQETGLKSKETIKMYALLVLTKGTQITLSDIHDGWSMAMNFKESNPPYCYGHEHKSIVPFKELSIETQEKDRKYLDALLKIAKERENKEKNE